MARGLLYLHRDSRFTIVHRDLKANNILLDPNLNPKISDFGIAVFVGNQIKARTKQITGTYGYMFPEYALDGKFSVKSDVFSLDVLSLGIMNGKRNRKFHHPDHYHSFRRRWHGCRGMNSRPWNRWMHVWRIQMFESQVLRCIQVGLLCVQKLAQDRPTISSVVSMFGSEEVTLALPKNPGFFVGSSSIDTETQTSTEGSGSALTITVLDAI